MGRTEAETRWADAGNEMGGPGWRQGRGGAVMAEGEEDRLGGSTFTLQQSSPDVPWAGTRGRSSVPGIAQGSPQLSFPQHYWLPP